MSSGHLQSSQLVEEAWEGEIEAEGGDWEGEIEAEGGDWEGEIEAEGKRLGGSTIRKLEKRR